MPTAQVGDINIYYESQGNGEPLLLIMGYGQYSALWAPLVRDLSLSFRVISFDNRGTGRSDKPDVPYTMKMMADDAKGLLDAIGIDSAHVFGMSMGGMIAQEFALSYPNKLRSLILGCTHCGGTNTILPSQEALAFLLGPEMAKLPVEERARQTVHWLWTREYIDNNPRAVELFVAVTAEYPTPLHGYRCQAKAIMGHDTYDRLPRIKATTLVITGDADRLIPAENSRILASRIPNAELVILENSGHGFVTDAREKATGEILDFLSRHSTENREPGR
ncbi:MAG: alpha/beta fold hydrolase [Chloroflexi bacterium]|nr:alpha/beta fold hydrolase [Chloroflexota bacterium]MBM4452418.1 alpha/beta fold hydrolase [Chloroflexota bacterium]MBM4453071.1 alpha/beta fold hydrolase [Chloroflexota bacterium]